MVQRPATQSAEAAEATAAAEGGGGGFLVRRWRLPEEALGGPASGAPPAPPATHKPRIRVVADPGTNSLLVRASIVDLMTIKKILDDVLDSGANDSDALIKTHIIKLQHASAYDVHHVIQEIFKEYTSTASSQSVSGGQLGGGLSFFGATTTRATGGKAVQLTMSYDDHTNALIVNCTDGVFESIDKLAKQLDDLAAESARTVKIVSVKGIDPFLVQQALDAIQGRRTISRNQQGGGFGGNGGISARRGGKSSGRSGGRADAGGFGGGARRAWRTEAASRRAWRRRLPRRAWRHWRSRRSRWRPSRRRGPRRRRHARRRRRHARRLGGTRGNGGGSSGGGGTRGRPGGGGQSPSDDGEARGPDFFESRDMDVPSRTLLYDPQLDRRVVQAQYTEMHGSCPVAAAPA